jgi:hypothetical protein
MPEGKERERERERLALFGLSLPFSSFPVPILYLVMQKWKDESVALLHFITRFLILFITDCN